MFVYLLGMHTGQLIENGSLLTIPEMKARAVEFAAGLYWLTPYIGDIARFTRRTVNAVLVPFFGSLVLPDD